MGGEGWQLIEPVDGFHPSQTGMVLTAEKFWNQIMIDRPEIFGPQNPYNDEIKKMQKTDFGQHQCSDD